MAPQYKFTYFTVKALGESVRFLLSYGGLEFEDKRVDFESWPALKPSMPFEQLPILEVDGKVAHQSVAISRYLAKQMKLTGNNDWEDLEIDSMVDTTIDLLKKLGLWYWNKDAAQRAAEKDVLFKENLPYYLTRLNESAGKNNGYLACGRLTWADVVFVSYLGYENILANMDITADYPHLSKLQQTILAIPNIKKYVENRPEDIFPYLKQ